MNNSTNSAQPTNDNNKSQDYAPATVIAQRKSCAVDGVGLSHYILVAEEKK